MSIAQIDHVLATDKFYEILFEIMPETQAMFESTEAQKQMFSSALMSIGHWEFGDAQLLFYLETLGKKHKDLGLTTEHMQMGKRAFVEAIEVGGKDLSEDRKQYFINVFNELERMMGFGVS
ncbi:MAG: hypothetical protein COB46_13135 [Rhodospirillaceae bacterium]|nr:MAG: hypothetical protein COB46_13135 [Rhodospirillaceae bacterium]